MSVWVIADVDFVSSFLSDRWFFMRNRRISRIVLRGNATTELSANNDEGNILFGRLS